MLELRKLNRTDAAAQWEFVTALPADENGFTNPYEGIPFDAYLERVLPEQMMHEHPTNMPDWFVPCTYYYLWEDDTLVGEYRIRHRLTEALRSGAGHIGYCIRKEHRGKGYGTKGLALTLEIAREIVPEDEIYFRVLKTNTTSFRVILKNGGRITGEDDIHYLLRISKYERD